MNGPELIVAGEYVSSHTAWGDLELVTCWPGGTESITFDVDRHHRSFRTDALVELDYGGIKIAAGSMMEPTRGEPLRAEGLFRKAEDFPALDGTGAITTVPNTAVTVAIAAGLPWATAPLDPLAAPLDPDQMVSLKKLLDHWADAVSQDWGVDANGLLVRRPWPEASVHMLPGVEGLGISRDGYASILIGRFLNSFDSIYYTVTREDAVASSRWGKVRRTIPEPLGDGAPMSTAQAAAVLDGLLAKGRAKIGWNKPLEVQFGDVVNEWGQPIDTWRLAGGQVIKLHDLQHNVADLDGGTTADLRIARTRHKGTSVTIEPQGLSSPMNDALAGVA